MSLGGVGERWSCAGGAPSGEAEFSRDVRGHANLPGRRERAEGDPGAPETSLVGEDHSKR